MKIYSYSTVEKYISEKLIPAGYDVYTLPGSLVDGYIAVAPDDAHYHFIAEEVYLNAWSSGVKLRKCRKLPKWAQKKIEEIRAA